MSKEKLFQAMGVNTNAKKATVDTKMRFETLSQVLKILDSERAKKLDNLIFTVGVITAFAYLCYQLDSLRFFDWPYSKFGLGIIPLMVLSAGTLWWSFKKKITDFVYLAKVYGTIMFFITIPICGLFTLRFSDEFGGTVGYNTVMIPLSINYTSGVMAATQLCFVMLLSVGLYIMKPVISSMWRELIHALYSVNDVVGSQLDLDRLLDEAQLQPEKRQRVRGPVEPKAIIVVDQAFKSVLAESNADGSEIVKVNKGHRLMEYFVKLPKELTPSFFDAKKLLAMRSSMGVKGIEFNELVEGMPKTVSFIVPRNDPETVDYQKGIESDEFRNCDCDLPMLMGADTNRKYIVIDLAKMPHVLVAGKTGGGKSKLLVAMLLSMMQTVGPDKLELIIIDPKLIEMVQFNGVHHLQGRPVVTDPAEAEEVLRLAAEEMDDRYTTMQQRSITIGKSIKNIAAYNKSLKGSIPVMKWRVIVIDEYADLSMTADKDKLEKYVARLGQKARAAGIHVIILTQRPTVDVITGIIKSNMPCRIALKVTTTVDSRVILDGDGAEKLLGQGDMLISHESVGNSFRRVYGSYIDDDLEDSILDELKRS